MKEIIGGANLALGKRILIVVVSILLIFLLFIKQFFFIVTPGERGLIVRLGNIANVVYDPWFHLKVPFIDSARYMNVQTQKIEKMAESASKDLQIVNSTIALNYNFDPSKIINLYQLIGSQDIIEMRIIEPAIQETVKASTAKFTAEELITKRAEVAATMELVMKEKLEKHGIFVSEINVIDYQFSAEFNSAIENKVRAEQEALAERNRLEKIKYEAQQKIETAKWESEALLLNAKAEAEAIIIKTQAIKAEGWKEYVQLQWINKWSWVLPTTNLADSNGVILDLSN